MANDWVTLTSYSYLTQAQLLKADLESEGIHSFLKDENTVNTNYFLGNAMGGIRVQVRESDFEKAVAVLKRRTSISSDSQKKDDEQWAKGFVHVDEYCPSCESATVYRKKFPKHWVILAIILAPIFGPLYVFIFLFKRTHVCTDCGHTWKQ
ncbi:MAG: DUF2007 domain-containing protein [Candidatus Kapabacteria bacterium]|nr:DUF2007 domain-containing protein [Candidatus Kapabacteria bacterium]